MDFRIRSYAYNPPETPQNVVPSFDTQYTARDMREYGAPLDNPLLVDMAEATALDYDPRLAVDSFIRMEIMERGPDKNLMECEEARGGVDARAGMIELRGHGTRGYIDNPYRPELFLGFAGKEDREPRGTNCDLAPDMKMLVKQYEARNRFYRFSKDDSPFVVDGHRAERQEIKDNQTIFKISRDRMRIFDRQIDGRTCGKSLSKYDNVSNICKQVLIQSYGDKIKDFALNPQRRATLVCDNIIRDCKEYRDSATDQDMDYMRYTMTCKQGPLRHENKARCGIMSQTMDFGQATKTKHYKAAAIRMRDLCNARANLSADQDADLATSKQTIQTKTAPIRRDITLITQNIDHSNTNFTESDLTQQSHTPTPQQKQQQIKQIDNDRVLPEMHYNNALIISKAAQHGDIRKAKDNVQTDTAGQADFKALQIRKNNTNVAKAGANPNNDYDADKCESRMTYHYKTNLALASEMSKLMNINGENFHCESDPTQTRKLSNNIYGTPTWADPQIGFGDNATKERHAAGIGSKYTHRYVQEDARDTAKFGDN